MRFIRLVFGSMMFMIGVAAVIATVFSAHPVLNTAMLMTLLFVLKAAWGHLKSSWR
ncbi:MULTISPECIES: hypothetical protein [unclassified Mesorhizobium]|uniref:hypothetical protein n=1 Tax=unclassified Mesorhizobium TaxID=325217 RepID=UPI0013E08E66|nr:MULTISPECIES: hypothetical protein [unclassified Mesorhizobium]MDG4855135.1 hypothetical protein [Mesorhizobium sp. WSM4982]MDG4913705.1 hypothetical protein [Mesorhizobium sp. WSM4983]